MVHMTHAKRNSHSHLLPFFPSLPVATPHETAKMMATMHKHKGREMARRRR